MEVPYEEVSMQNVAQGPTRKNVGQRYPEFQTWPITESNMSYALDLVLLGYFLWQSKVKCRGNDSTMIHNIKNQFFFFNHLINDLRARSRVFFSVFHMCRLGHMPELSRLGSNQ